MSEKYIKFIGVHNNKDSDGNVLVQNTRIEPCTVKRPWMNNTTNSFAYRCLPLNIANQHGWAVYPNHEIVAMWDGLGIDNENIKITKDGNGVASAHFGHRVLTFSFEWIVQTPPGWNLFVTGAPNFYINGISPLSGIIETDWAPYSFTMNWIFTQDMTTAVWTRKDPLCFLYPIQRGYIEEFNTQSCILDEMDSDFTHEYNEFCKRRKHFNEVQRFEENRENDWQRMYYTGKTATGKKLIDDHQIKLRLNNGS